MLISLTDDIWVNPAEVTAIQSTQYRIHVYMSDGQTWTLELNRGVTQDQAMADVIAKINGAQ